MERVSKATVLKIKIVPAQSYPEKDTPNQRTAVNVAARGSTLHSKLAKVAPILETAVRKK